MRNWTIFSNHGHVLVCLVRDTEARLRDVAADVGITERAVQKIVRDLHGCGMLSVSKRGRRNQYHIHLQQTLRHALESHCSLAKLIEAVGEMPLTETAGNALTAEKYSTGPASNQPQQPAKKSAKPTRVDPVQSRPMETKVTVPGPEGGEPEKQKDQVNGGVTQPEKQQGSLF